MTELEKRLLAEAVFWFDRFKKRRISILDDDEFEPSERVLELCDSLDIEISDEDLSSVIDILADRD